MNPRCEAVLSQAAASMGRSLRSPEIKNIEKNIREMGQVLARKDPESWRKLSREERDSKISEALAKKFEHDAIKANQVKAQSAVADFRTKQELDIRVGHGLTGVKAMQHAIVSIFDAKGRGQSAETRAQVILHNQMQKLYNLFEFDKEGGLYGLLHNEEGWTKFAKEMKGEDTGDARVKALVKQFREINGEFLKEYNRIGGDIANLADWLPQSMDIFRVYGSLSPADWLKSKAEKTKIRQDNFINKSMEHIDREKYLDDSGKPISDAEMRDFLREAWWTLSTGGYAKDKTRKQYASDIANRHKQHRQLHWKSGESHVAMMKEFGAGSMFDQIQSHYESLSRDMAMMEQFGPRALSVIDQRIADAVAIDKKAGTYDQKELAHLERMVDHFSGKSGGVGGNVSVHKFFSDLKSMNVATLLGSILTSQLGDNGTAITVARANGATAAQWGLHKMSFYTDEHRKQFGRSAGLAFDVLIDGATRWGDSMNGSSLPGKFADTMFKITGANKTTSIHRSAVATFHLDYVGGLTKRTSWDELDTKAKEMFEGNGFSKLDWDIYRLAGRDESYGKSGLGMKQIADIPAEKIRALIPDVIKDIESRNADIVNRLDVMNDFDRARIDKRGQKFAEWRGKTQKIMDDYLGTRDKRVGDYDESAGIRIDLLKEKIESAELKAELNSAYMTAGKESAEYVDLGEKIGKSDAKIKEIEKRLKDYQKTAGKESFKKATDIEKRIDSRMAELDEYTTKTEERIAEREKFMASYEASVGGKINQAIEDARNEASSTITGWAIEQANLAVLQPSLYTKTLQGMMYEKGSVLGELGSAFMQFKQFPIAMVTQHFMQRSVGTGGTFNIIKYNLELLALTSIFGGMGLIMGDLAQGKDPREIFEDDGTKRLRDFGLQAMLKGGGLGIFGNILQTDFTGRRAFEQIAGPSFSKAMNLARLGEGAFDPKMNFGKAALDVSKDWTPGQNYLFTRAVYHNYLMASLYELAQPGYAGRMRGLAEKNLGTEYFMGYGVEPRAPNFGNIYQDR